MAYLFDKKNGYRLLDAAGFVLKDVEGAYSNHRQNRCDYFTT